MVIGSRPWKMICLLKCRIYTCDASLIIPSINTQYHHHFDHGDVLFWKQAGREIYRHMDGQPIRSIDDRSERSNQLSEKSLSFSSFSFRWWQSASLRFVLDADESSVFQRSNSFQRQHISLLLLLLLPSRHIQWRCRWFWAYLDRQRNKIDKDLDKQHHRHVLFFNNKSMTTTKQRSTTSKVSFIWSSLNRSEEENRSDDWRKHNE